MIQTIDRWSETLGQEILLKVICPEEGECQKLMILLHGKMYPEENQELFDNIPSELELEKLCEKCRMLIVLPLMKNRYYISTEDYPCERFISWELLNDLSHQYRISKSAERILAGISMGGFGAVLIGARTNSFQKIISISGSFITEDVEMGNPEVWGELSPDSVEVKDTFLYHFLPLENLLESTERNALAALRLLSQREDKPQVIVTCGTKDWLYCRNETLKKELEQKGIPYVFYKLEEGDHEAECFKNGLWKAMDQKAGNYE